jgi:hypothetical protein
LLILIIIVVWAYVTGKFVSRIHWRKMTGRIANSVRRVAPVVNTAAVTRWSRDEGSLHSTRLHWSSTQPTRHQHSQTQLLSRDERVVIHSIALIDLLCQELSAILTYNTTWLRFDYVSTCPRITMRLCCSMTEDKHRARVSPFCIYYDLSAR